jgi:YidC/Oxa1 family membrane protein insertase
MLSCLTHHVCVPVCYVSSEQNDPGLLLNDPLVTPIYIGRRAARTIFFLVVDAAVMVMTMPDLNTFHIKRSKHPVHYVYVFHSMVSTHMIYRQQAFDHYDTILCVGPHHLSEIRETEALHGLAAKTLVEHGHGRLDSILQRAARTRRQPDRPARMLLAPSWGAGGILETCGHVLIDALLAGGFHVTVRPHPQLRKNNPKLVASYRKRFAGRPELLYEDDVVSEDSFHDSDLMISDWSGAALEYAFGVERPVLFIDVPRKVNNPDYIRYVNQPIEDVLRPELGAVLAPERVAEVPIHARRLVAEGPMRAPHLAALRTRWVFNVGTSAVRGAETIAGVAAKRPP